MEKPSKLTTKKLILILAAVFVVCGLALGVFAFFRNSIKEVAAETDYGYINSDETKAETDAGFTIDGVLDEAQYQKNNWLYLSNKEDGADVDIAMTSYYGEKGMYFVYDVTERTPIYVNTDRASYLNSCVEMYLAPNTVINRNQNSVFEIDLLPTGDMTFKKSNGKGGYVNVATTDDMMAVLGTTTKGGEVNTEDCYGYCLELFIPWEYMDKFDLDAGEMKDSYVYVNPAHITSFNYEGTDTSVDRYWYHFAQQHGAGLSNVYQYYRFDGNGVQGTVPVELQAGEHYTIEGGTAVIPGMKTNVTITPEKGYALNSILINGEEYITKANFNEDGAVTITERGAKDGMKISASAVLVADGNKTLSGTVVANKYGGGSLKDVSASYTGPTGEKPLEFDSKGKFTLTDLKPGYYKFTIEKEGYEKLVRGIYVNRDMEVELSLEYQAFTVTGASWVMDDQNDGIIYKFGGSGNLLSNEKYNKFAVEATFHYDKEAAKAGDADVFSQQRKGLKVAFSNEKVWHIDLLFQDGKYIVQYAKHSGSNSLTGWKEIHALTAAEAAKFTGEDGIKLSVERDGKFANVYLDGKRIAVEVLDDEFAKCTAQIGFEAWAANRQVEEIPYKITAKTSVNMKNTLFKMTKGWDVLSQYDGLISMPEGGRGNLQFINKYVNMDFTLRVKDDRTMKEYDKDGKELFPRTDVLFVFENGAHISFGTSTDEDGMRIQSLNNAANTVDGKSTQYIYKRWTDWGTLTDEEFEQYINGGVDLRIVRYGTEITLYIGDRMIGIADLTKNDSGVTADMPATVTIRHYDDAGVKIDMPFSLKEPSELVNVTAATSKNGKIVTEKKQYFVGDTVKVSGKGNEGYYCNAIKVNGQNVTLNWDGTYTFTATEKNYTVEGNYVKRVFKDSKEWNLLKQNEGVISVPKDHDGDSSWVEFYKQYEDIDLTLTTRDYIGNNAELRTVVRFAFENGETLMLSVAYTNNTYQMQSMNDTFYGWRTHRNLSDDQIATFQSEEGINLRLVRMGTEVLAYLDDALIKVCDLTTNKSGKATEITADTPMTVSIRHYGNDGFAAEIPFEVKEEVPEVVTGNIDLPNGGNLNTEIKHYVEDLDLTVKAQDHPDSSEGANPRTDVLFVFENGAHISFGISSDGNGAQIKALNRNKNDNEQIYGQWTEWGTLTDEEFEQYKNGGVDLRIVRCGTEISVYVGDRFLSVADLTNNNRGVTADTKAKVTVRHYDDAGAKMNIPFEWTEVLNLITVKKAECEHGKVVTQKENYIMGDTVIISGKADDGYYCTGLKVNGEDVAMEMMNGTYTFKATEKEYTVAATFAKSIFKTDKLSYWNILKQQEGIIIHRDDFTDRETAQPLYFVDTYKNSNASIIVKANADDFNADGTLKDANGDRSGIGYETSKGIVGFSILLDTKGVYHVAHAGTSGQPEGTWGSFYKLSEAETKMITEGNGIELRVIRIGTEAKVYLDGKLIRTQALPYEADEATSVWMRRWDDRGVLAEIPFTISEEVPQTVAINIADTTNGTVATQYKNYFANEQVTLVINPKEGYDCTSLKVNGSEVAFTDNKYTFTATEMSYTVEAVFEQKVTITIADTTHGTITKAEEQYYVGDTVVLTVAGDTGYYYDSLKVNGKDVALCDDGTYSFEAVETSYEVTGSFAESIFTEHAEWNLTKQHEGAISVPNCDGNVSRLDTKKSTYKDMELTVRDYTPDAKNFKLEVRFKFGNGEEFKLRLENCENDEKIYRVQLMSCSLLPSSLSWTSAHDFTVEETNGIKSENGIKFRVAMIGTEAKIYLDKTEVYSVDVSSNKSGNASDVANQTAQISLWLYGCTGSNVKMPFVLWGKQEPVTVNIDKDITNGTITTEKEQYYVGDTVVLTVVGDTGYYYNSLKVNDKKVKLSEDGTYSFMAVEKEYTVTGNFAESIFAEHAEWNLTKQHDGVISVPNCDGNVSRLDTKKSTYKDMELTVRDYTPDAKNFKLEVRFKFGNNEEFKLRLENCENDGKIYRVQLMSCSLLPSSLSWTSAHDFTVEETNAIKSENGIKFRVAIVGTEAKIYLDETEVYSVDVSTNKSGNASDVANQTAQISLWWYGSKDKNVEMPFVLGGKPESATVTIANNITKGSITADKTSYIVGEKVTLTVAGDAGFYYDSLKVDGKEVTVEADGTYTFTATKTNHTVEGSFKESIFAEQAEWNLIKQHEGVISVPKCDGASGRLDTKLASYREITLFLKDPNPINKFNVDLQFKFGTETFKAGVIIDGGKYKLRNINGTLNKPNWETFDVLSDEAIAKIKGESGSEGLKFRLAIIGTTAKAYIEDEEVKTWELDANKVGNKTAQVSIWVECSAGYTVEIPFTLGVEPATANISVAKNIANGASTTDKVLTTESEKYWYKTLRKWWL